MNRVCVALHVDDEAQSNWLCSSVTSTVCVDSFALPHARSVGLHVLHGTHRLAEPVSNNTLNVCFGVPIVIGP